MLRTALGLLTIVVAAISYPADVDAGPFGHRRCQTSSAPSAPCCPCECYLYVCIKKDGTYQQFPHTFIRFSDAYVAGQLYRAPDGQALHWVRCTPENFSNPQDHTFTVCGCPEPVRCFEVYMEYDLYYCEGGSWAYKGTYGGNGLQGYNAAEAQATKSIGLGGGGFIKDVDEARCTEPPTPQGKYLICASPNDYNGQSGCMSGKGKKPGQ